MKRNPFTPGLPVDPDNFIGRKKEIKYFEESLAQSSYANPQNIAIIGDRGIGKSSLLRKFESLATEKECLVIRRELDSSVDSLEMLSYFILTSIKSEGKRYFSKTKKVKDKVSNFFNQYKIEVSLSGIGGSIEKKIPRVAIQEDLFYELSKISNNLQSDVPSIVIMLDEAEHLQNIDGSWGFLRSVFTRLLEKKHNFLLVVSGKLDLFKNIKEIFSPMERFFFPNVIDNLNKEETIEAIATPLEKNGFSISNETKNIIADYTDGHPFVIQVFGFYLFTLNAKVINQDLFNKELPKILERLKTQVFEDRYSRASPLEKEILEFMAKSDKNIFRPIEIKRKLEIENPGLLMLRLVEKDCLKKVGHGNYSIYHKLFKQYILNQQENIKK